MLYVQDFDGFIAQTIEDAIWVANERSYPHTQALLDRAGAFWPTPNASNNGADTSLNRRDM